MKTHTDKALREIRQERRELPRYLGTTHGGEYKLYLVGGYVYQENKFGRNVGWICSWPSFHAFARSLD